MERSMHSLAQKSRKRIVDSLICLLGKKSYESITVSELCRKAQVDRRTFYRNFRNKEDVMEFHISALKEEYLSFLNRLEKRNIRSMAESQFVFWKKHLPFLTSLQSRSALSGLLLQTSNEFIPTVYLQYHNDLPSHFEYKARFVIGGFVNILLYWIETGTKEDPEEIAEIAAELFDEDNPYWTGYVQKHR